MKLLKRTLLVIAALLVVILIWQWELVNYGLQQAKGQYHVISNAKPVEEFLNDPNFPDSLKAKIELIQEIRTYAIDSLGLTDSENYTTLFDQKGEDILWNLSAAYPYKMEPKTWSFPMLGSFPYKGFFELDRAKEERDLLKDEGYDTRIRSVGGWSTLGWFKDPILSNMLARGDGRLADLIIHELTHATLFVKDSIEFNENLASFIGKKGAEQFIRSKYGPDSKEMDDYLQYFEDSKSIVNHMLAGYKALDSLYTNFENFELPDSTKQIQKTAVLTQIISSLDTITFSRPERLKKAFEHQLPNNAYFMSFQRYGAKQDLFMDEYLNNFEGDIKSFITYYKSKYPSL